MFKTSVIIPTYNRPVDLKNCIESLLKQTVRPTEIIVVDDGNLEELPLASQCKEANINYIYYKKDKPGLTESRNRGIKLSHGDIIFFFDDDVILYDSYIEETLKVYKEDKTGAIGGVGGMITNQKPVTMIHGIRRILEMFFLVTGKEGKVLPSGFCTNFGSTLFPIKKITGVDFLSGGVSSFRKEVFNEFTFDTDTYLNYGLGEDKDFTYRVSNKYKLIFNPAAKVLHMEATSMRPEHFKKSKMMIISNYVFFKRYVKTGPLSWILFYYAVLGYTLSRMIILLMSPSKENQEKLNGVFHGIKDVIFKSSLKIN
ncbi:MAG: glycosyltransferase [Candidatus Magnetoovum sp. WYHC-5]|nr:glycosyltransferase [Candidatus Magnetoovum sp. WYHC-5]